eukprot:gene39250-47768_t
MIFQEDAAEIAKSDAPGKGFEKLTWLVLNSKKMFILA